jgi:hypothetical protein
VPSTTRRQVLRQVLRHALRHVLRLTGTAAMAPLASRATWAQGSGDIWPTKPIRLIVPLVKAAGIKVN